MFPTINASPYHRSHGMEGLAAWRGRELDASDAGRERSEKSASETSERELRQTQTLRDMGYSESTIKTMRVADRAAARAYEVEQAASYAAKVIDLAARHPIPTPEPETRKRSANRKYANDEERQAAVDERRIQQKMSNGRTREQVLAKEAAQRRANMPPPNLVKVRIPG